LGQREREKERESFVKDELERWGVQVSQLGYVGHFQILVFLLIMVGKHLKVLSRGMLQPTFHF
jgi:hypothetical protein